MNTQGCGINLDTGTLATYFLELLELYGKSLPKLQFVYSKRKVSNTPVCILEEESEQYAYCLGTRAVNRERGH